MEPTPPALALAAAALDALGIDGPPKHLSGRKGADVWRAGDWRIKTATPGARGHLAHETAAYELLHRQDLHPGPRQWAGDTGRWMAVPWLDGQSLWEAFAPARDGHATPAQRDTMREAARAALAALADLHLTGWTHGDMQTENALLLDHDSDETTTVEFIDFDLSAHPELPRGFPYRGGLVHVIAPETAALLLATDDETDVELTAPAELFALGAGLYWAWTGQRITDYRGDAAGAHDDLYADIADGRRRDLAHDRPWADADLEALIHGATQTDPGTRRYS